MSKTRPPEWMDQFGHLLNVIEDEDTKALVLDGSIEICPVCDELSAHAWQETTAYDQFTDGIIPGGFKPEPGTIAHIGNASCFDWQCGHCKRSFTTVDSPINHPCYTHADPDEESDD